MTKTNLAWSVSRTFLVLIGLLTATSPSVAQPFSTNYTVSFVDPGGANSAYYTSLTSHIQAAGTLWSNGIVSGANNTIRVEVSFTTAIPKTTGGSTTTNFVSTAGGVNVFEQGAAALYRGSSFPYRDPTSDVKIRINQNYMANELWFDPDPTGRTTTVPTNRTDAMSVMIHELGHAIAFNGWRDGVTGALPIPPGQPGSYMSTFDSRVVEVDGNLYFNGTAAETVYGGPVPLTYGNYGHVGNGDEFGNPNGRPGNNLVPDMMNGVVFNRGGRYEISTLDWAILQDTGLTIVPVPEPTAVGVISIVALLLVRRSRKSKLSVAT